MQPLPLVRTKMQCKIHIKI